MKEDTTIVSAGRHPERHGGAVNPPVYRVSTVLARTLDELEARDKQRFEVGAFIYGRFGTPTSFALEEAVKALEGAHACVATNSGVSAITSALLAVLGSGDHLLVTDSVYGPSRRFCEHMLKGLGVETTFYDPLVGAGIAALFRDNTRAVFVEAPGSLTFEMQDIPAIAAVARERGAKVIMDNTWATPIFFKPLAHGVDISIQAATKYIVGHSDAVLGTIATTEEVWPAVQNSVRQLGMAAGAEEVYLGQRGLRTLGVRLRRHQETGLLLAKWFAERPEVARVLHPALPDDPGHEIWRRDFTGACGLFGVILAKPYPRAGLATFLDGLEHFGMGYSWGGYESLLVPTHPERFRSVNEWDPPGPTLRVHAGLEDPDDLIEDLERGLARLTAAV